nr:hypothetical protein [Gordonia westfalica]
MLEPPHRQAAWSASLADGGLRHAELSAPSLDEPSEALVVGHTPHPIRFCAVSSQRGRA